MGNTPSDVEGEDGGSARSARSARSQGSVKAGRGRKQSREGDGEVHSLLKPAFDPGDLSSPKAGALAPVAGFGRGATPHAGELRAEANYEEMYAVHVAAHEGDVARLRKALEDAPAFNPYDASQRTPLYYCAASDNIDCLEAILQARPDIINLGDNEGDTPLHIASYYGHAAVLQLLLRYEAQANIRNSKGATPLHVCSSIECCKLLMDYGGDLFAQDKDGRVPLFSACASDKTRIVGEIINNPRFDATQMLMVQDTFGDSALHAAAGNGSLDCIKQLRGFIDLQLIRISNARGMSAEDVARANHQEACAKYIHDLMLTLYKAQDDRLRSGSGMGMEMDPRRFSMFHQPSNWGNFADSFAYGNDGGYSRPGTAAGHGYFGNHNNPAGGMLDQFGRSGTGLGGFARPQSAQGYRQDYMLPNIGVDSPQDEADVWNVFSKPYDEGGAIGADGTEYDLGGEDGDRPKTPWTLRRENATMEDWHGEWAQFMDKETGQPFWWNSISGECQWEAPARVVLGAGGAGQHDGMDEEAIPYEEVGGGGGGADVSEAEQIRQRAFVLDRIGSWSECQDPVTQDIFYYNNETGECEWELPPEAAALREKERAERRAQLEEEAQAEAQEWVFKMRKNTEASLEIPTDEENSPSALASTENWDVVTDEASGQKYYVHKSTGETCWEEPAEVAKARAKMREEARERDLDDLREKLKAEAAAQIAEQVRAAISSTEEERERMRREFEEKMQETAAQTQKLAEKLEGESAEARKRKEAEILKLRDKEHAEEEKNKRSEEKAELLAEHGEELKQLASVLSADRVRQNEKLQEKLKERRRARALKRAQMLNQAKAKTPTSPLSPKASPPAPLLSPSQRSSTSSSGSSRALVRGPSGLLVRKPSGQLVPMSPAMAKQLNLEPKSSATPSSVPELPNEVQALEQTKSDLFGAACAEVLGKASKQTPALEHLFKTHLQYIPKASLEAAEQHEHGRPMVGLLWSVFRLFACENRRSALPTKLSEETVALFLNQGESKLPLAERQEIVHAAFAEEDAKHIKFEAFLALLVNVLNRLGCPVAAFVKSTLTPLCIKATRAMQSRGKAYQIESKRLATDAVRKLLHVNVSQLKILYIYYAIVAEKRKSPCPRKTITMEEMMLFAKDFVLIPKLCSVKQLVQVYDDMALRKPGEAASLAEYVLPFNQWVQLLFHAALRFCPKEGADKAAQAQEEAHRAVIRFLEYMDKSGGKGRVKAKGLKPFICVVAEAAKQDPEEEEEAKE